MWDTIGDKVVGFITYWVLLFDTLKLRSAAGTAISAAYQGARNGIGATRVAVARAIASPMARFMEWYAFALGVVVVLTSILRFSTVEDGGSGWWSYGLFLLTSCLSVIVILSSAAKQRKHGTENITGWVNAQNQAVPETSPDAIPVHHGDDKPLRVSFFKSGAILEAVTCAMGIALCADMWAIELRWIVLPVLALVGFGVLVLRVLMSIVSWVLERGIPVLEKAGEIAVQPLGALPGLYFDKLNEQIFKGGHLNLFDEDSDAAAVDHIVPFIIQAVIPYLIVVFEIGANRLWSLIFGMVFLMTYLAGLAFAADGDPDSVDLVTTRRRRFFKWLFMAVPLITIVSVGGWELLPDSRWHGGISQQKIGFYDWITAVLYGRESIMGVHSWWDYVLLCLISVIALAVVIWAWKRTQDLTGRIRPIARSMVALVLFVVVGGLLNKVGFVGNSARGIALPAVAVDVPSVAGTKLAPTPATPAASAPSAAPATPAVAAAPSIAPVTRPAPSKSRTVAATTSPEAPKQKLAAMRAALRDLD